MRDQQRQNIRMMCITAAFGMMALTAGCETTLAAPAEAQAAEAKSALPACEGGPVFMVVAGETLDLQRMIAYSKALQETGLYPSLHGYYINAPRPIRTYEGTPPDNYAHLMVRFPSVCAADAFWYSEAYQNDIKPLRENPPAGNYTVTVYAQSDLPEYMRGKVDGVTGEYIGE